MSLWSAPCVPTRPWMPQVDARSLWTSRSIRSVIYITEKPICMRQEMPKPHADRGEGKSGATTLHSRSPAITYRLPQASSWAMARSCLIGQRF